LRTVATTAFSIFDINNQVVSISALQGTTQNVPASFQEVSTSCNTDGYRTFFPIQPTQIVKVDTNGQLNFQFNGFCYFDQPLFTALEN
jgi:hypothetical protein